MLYDQWGDEIKPEKRPDERVIAVASIRDRWSTYPSNGLTPQSLATIFREADQGVIRRQAELFEEMEEKDPHLFSCLQTRKLAITGLHFEIEPFSEDAQDQKIADYVADAINDLPDFEDNLMDIADAMGKGISMMEIYWDIRNGKNVIRHLEWVHPKRIAWHTTLKPRLLTDDNQFDGIELPPFKTIVHRHKTRSGHPNRQGVLRTVAWMYLFKNYAIKDWIIFAEVFGMPLRLGKFDSTASKEDKEALIQAVRSLGADAAGVISKSTEIEFVEAVKNSGREVYDVLVDFCNGEMSKAVLGQTLTTQQGESGSYSLGQVHNEVRGDLLKSDCEMISKTLRRDMIQPLVGYNFGWDAPLPWFKFHYEKPEDLISESTKIKNLVDSGVKTIPVSWVHEKFNIPKPKDGEETLTAANPPPNPPPANPPPNPPPAGDSSPPLEGAGGGAIRMKACPGCLVNKDQSNRTHQTEMLAGKMHDAISLDVLIDAIKKLAEESATLQEFKEKILKMYPKLDTREMTEIISNALLVAELGGRVDL